MIHLTNWKQFDLFLSITVCPLCSQVKIWFQNRRAKERKLIKKKMGQSDGSGGSVHSDPGSVSPLPVPRSLSPSDIHGSMYPPTGMSALPSMRNIQQVTVTQWTRPWKIQLQLSTPTRWKDRTEPNRSGALAWPKRITSYYTTGIDARVVDYNRRNTSDMLEALQILF